jgi:hypothetical protein
MLYGDESRSGARKRKAQAAHGRAENEEERSKEGEKSNVIKQLPQAPHSLFAEYVDWETRSGGHGPIRLLVALLSWRQKVGAMGIGGIEVRDSVK